MALEKWDIKYRPKHISEYIFHNQNYEEKVKTWIKDKEFPDLLLYGQTGSGKTSLAYLLKSELNIDDYDFLHINASKENSIDTVRGKIDNFISGMPVSSFMKILLLDEFDYFTPNAQASLRGIIEDERYASYLRIIFTCNYPQKIIPALHSRCLTMEFSAPDKLAMTERFISIFNAEGIKLGNLDRIKEWVNQYYPDFRHLIISAQNAVKEGILQPFDDVVFDTTEFMVHILDYLEKNNWIEIRNYLSQHVNDNQWDSCYKFLYDYLHDIGKFKDTMKWKKGIITISDHLEKHTRVADPEINFTACLIKLSEI